MDRDVMTTSEEQTAERKSQKKWYVVHTYSGHENRARLSLQERYRNHGGFVSAVAHAARDLVKARFLLEEDAQRYVDAASESEILKPAGKAKP